jgi:hypothetical protein
MLIVIVNVKGKGTSNDNYKADSTDAIYSGGLDCSSDETSVMEAEQRIQTS